MIENEVGFFLNHGLDAFVHMHAHEGLSLNLILILSHEGNMCA